MLKLRFFIVVSLSSIFAVGIYAQNNTPVDAVTSFYKFDQSHSQDFNKQQIDARKKWLSEELYKLFLNELKREKEYLLKNPQDKPYFGDGLPFQPLDETCEAEQRTYHKEVNIGPVREEVKRASVQVTFAFPKACEFADAVTYTLEMVKPKKDWLIDNVIYSETSNLLNDLKRKEY